MSTMPKLMVFAVTQVLFAQHVELTAFSRSTLAIYGQSPAGRVALDARQLEVRLTFPHGKWEEGTVTVIFDRASGYYLWHYLPNEAGVPDGFRAAFVSGEAAVYVAPDKLVEFHMPGSLGVREWITKADNLDHAEQEALNKIGSTLAEHEFRSFGDEMKEIPVPDLGVDFRCAPLSAICNSPTKIVDITREDDQWRLSIESRGTAELVLDKEYKVIHAVRTQR